MYIKKIILKYPQFEAKTLVYEVTKSINLTMFLIGVWTTIIPLTNLMSLKTLIMQKIETNNIVGKIINFIKSMVVGVALVEIVGLSSDYKT